MQPLKIHVMDTVNVVDSVDDATFLIGEAIKKWLDNPYEESTKQLEILLVRQMPNAPPALGIHVREEVSAEESLG